MELRMWLSGAVPSLSSASSLDGLCNEHKNSGQPVLPCQLPYGLPMGDVICRLYLQALASLSSSISATLVPMNTLNLQESGWSHVSTVVESVQSTTS